MTLSSAIFIFCFLPAFVVFFHASKALLKGGIRDAACKLILLFASVLFYAFAAMQYLPLLLGLALLTYLLALVVGKEEMYGRKALLAVGVSTNIIALAFYKYFNFFGEQLDLIFDFGFTSVSILQPLGISFLVFSLISYLVDAYRGTITPDKNLLNVLLWATFFPKITSGPIVRYANMFPERNSEGAVIPFASSEGLLADISYGARRFVIGLGKKVIIADTLGVVVDEIFTAQLTGIDTPTAWLGIICYTFQIFFDFAGYSDMAIGAAAMFGFRFKENFNYPYVAKTIGEFWHRWHISLSTWLRDYVYFALGGSRRSNVYFNLLVTFLVSGLWHGADWHFIAWGLWYAIFMFADRIYRQHESKFKAPGVALWAATMLVVILGWVFFRADGMNQAITYLGNLFGIGVSNAQFFGFAYYFDNRIAFLLLVSALCSTPLFANLRSKYEGTTWWEAIRCIGIPALFVLAVLFMINSSYSPFLYAQF